MHAPRYAVEPGDRAPNFALPGHRGRDVEFYGHVQARPTLLLFCPGLAAGGEAALQALAAQRDALRDRDANVVAVLPDPPPAAAAAAEALGLDAALLSDGTGQARALYLRARGAQPGAAAAGTERRGTVGFVLDANQRTVAVLDEADPAKLVAGALTALARPGLRAVPGAQVPVLIVPGVFSPADCEGLIALWRDKGHEEGTVGATSSAGGYHNVTSEHRKARDHIIRDPALNARLRGVLGPRLGDEIYKAFNFRIAFIGEFYIVCYDAGRGDFFGPHRDNWHPQHAHRRFAVTLSLNGGAYAGGGVRFPEYAPDAFDPPLGAAVVFSCSLLHEAVPVTEGQRFILSGFMWGEAEQRHLAGLQGRLRQGAQQQ